MSSLMKWTDASQKAKNAPPEWLLLKPSVHVLWSPVHWKLSLPWGVATCPTASLPLQPSGPAGLRTPTHVAA